MTIFFAGHLIENHDTQKKVFSMKVIVVTLHFPTASNYLEKKVA
jgi:hypothetical protein